ncbi:glycosyltransferase family 4 protein [Brevundimonas sp. SL161]|uniref:glycosyltransferase family 4 protein n=1 Tax=Brevundimonas sp. SL161 TaxID=2804613 RepID=UPI003CF941B9
MNFAIFSAGDAYSTDKKIMGRQSAGKAMIRGVARRWPNDDVHVFGQSRAAGQSLATQLSSEGHKGAVRWRESPGDAILDQLGAVYYPAPITPALANARNTRGPASYSLFGVTHTLSSEGAMDQVASLVLPPFKPWDALICTSNAALGVVRRLQDEMREWQARETGATRFNAIQLPVIPLGVDTPAFVRSDRQITEAREAVGLANDEVAFLFAGRLSFHAKANPSALYQALESASARTGQRLVCVEAGVYPNTHMAKAFAAARTALAPSVRFIGVDGENETHYRQAWRAADVFVSLSDNIQETFGLTPLEAMAAAQPVLVSDWNGYKDTVRDGIDGFRIPVTLPMAGAGSDLAVRHALGRDTYDFFIGRVSMATVVNVEILADRIAALANDAGLRKTLGAAGAQRARALFDWPVILDRYVDLAQNLADIRRAATSSAPEAWPLRPDPFALFADFPTHTLTATSKIQARVALGGVEALLGLEIARYSLIDPVLTAEMILTVHRMIHQQGEIDTQALIATSGLSHPQTVLALMWLAKLNLVELRP